MISILIPVYNYDVRSLVAELLQQGRSTKVAFEILCFDDGSAEDYKVLHRPFNEEPEVYYREMPENLGRARIRNHLAETAQYQHLLFLDADSAVHSDQYLQNYLNQADGRTVLCGGRCYDEQAPADPALLLHWQVGRHREQIPVGRRQQKPYHSFMTNNFLIPTNLFQGIRFDESIRQYGHEDTLFGFQLKKAQIPIRHIDNPLEHTGLETAPVFLQKTRQAIDNLLAIKQAHPYLHTRLLQTYESVSFLQPLLKICWQWGHSTFERRLYKEHPRLTLFDIYKLLYLSAQK